VLHTDESTPENASKSKSRNKNKHRPDMPEPLLLDAEYASALSGISVIQWWRMHAAAQVPECIKIGRRTLWRRSDVEKWIAWGCPSRKEFTARMGAEKK
jgi:predicted DNA-binding transcriptional regulator AlpA